MPTVRRSDAAELAIRELATEQPDGGSALRREVESVERTLSVLPRSGKEVGRSAGISAHTLITPSGSHQVAYLYDLYGDFVEIDNVVPTRSSLKR